MTLFSSILITSCTVANCIFGHGFYVSPNVIVATDHATVDNSTSVGYVLHRDVDRDLVFIWAKNKGKVTPCTPEKQLKYGVNFHYKTAVHLWEGWLPKAEHGDSGSAITDGKNIVGMLVGYYNSGGYYGLSCAEINQEYEKLFGKNP